MENKKRPIRSLLLILLALAVGLGAGFYAGHTYALPEENEFHLTVTANEEAGWREISSEELGGNYDGITYLHLDAVTITINGRDIPLEEAIRDGHITVEKLIAQAKEDVRNKKCTLKYDTDLGASVFIYSYPDAYDLSVRYDVFECSDGEQYLITDFVVTPPGRARDISYGFTLTDENGNRIDLLYEDWGLEFTVAEASSTDITLNYTQWGGMANGDLSVQYFILDDASENMSIEMHDLEAYMDPVPLKKNTTMGELTLNWQEKYGELEPGEYTIYLYVYDTFNEAEVHPLMLNYRNGQLFPVTFTVS